MMCWAGRQTQTQTHLDGLGAQLSSRPTYSISFFFPIAIDNEQ